MPDIEDPRWCIGSTKEANENVLQMKNMKYLNESQVAIKRALKYLQQRYSPEENAFIIKGDVESNTFTQHQEILKAEWQRVTSGCMVKPLFQPWIIQQFKEESICPCVCPCCGK